MSTSPLLRVAVIETGEVPEDLVDTHGDYVQQVAAWLAPALPEATFVGLRVVRGQPLGLVEEHDAYVITGSKHGVYDSLSWIPKLEAFVRQCGDKKIPVFGICFGHQLLAQAYGAPVGKADRGWGIGRQTYVGTGFLTPHECYVFHQDQVLEVPHNAVALGGNDFCPLGALRYDIPALSVQFHPEFEPGFLRDLLDTRGATMDANIIRSARESMTSEPDSRPIARWAAQFIRESVRHELPAPGGTASPAILTPAATATATANADADATAASTVEPARAGAVRDTAKVTAPTA
jgi:GMP synthase-like glutamine amidotransferase